MYDTYIIQSEENRYYIGHTENTEIRLQQHNNGTFKGWTTRYTNWKLVYSESFSKRAEAIKREYYIKSMKGGEGFKRLLRLHQRSLGS